LGFQVRSTVKFPKTNPSRRRAVAEHFLRLEGEHVTLTDTARWWIECGFDADHSFDAMAGLLAMLKIIMGGTDYAEPRSPDVRRIEGWVFGQGVPSPPAVNVGPPA
jgi:hypothetical protein